MYSNKQILNKLNRAVSFSQRSAFSGSSASCSHIGSSPVYFPLDVQCTLEPVIDPKVIHKGKSKLTLSQNLKVKGPKGELNLVVPDFITLNKQINEETKMGKITVSINDTKDRYQKAMWGTVAATLSNNITGVTEGHVSILKLVGVGYRAAVVDSEINSGKKYLSIKTGASHPQGREIPDDLHITSPQPTSIIIEGINKQRVKNFAASIRLFRPPEPYKGKGIFVDNEAIKMKAKKIK